MKKIFSIIALVTLALGFVACNDKWEYRTDGDNKSGSLALNSIVVDVTNPDGTTAGRATYILDDFTVTVFDKSNGAQEGTSYIFKSMPDIITLPVGEYYVEVTSGAVERAAFDAPYFKGRSDAFTITDGEITNIGTVTCTLANIKVTIKYTDALLKAAGTDSKVTVIANDEGRLDFALTETRSGYFQALEGSSTLVASFNGTINGYTENNIRRIYTDVKAGDHYIITFGLASNPNMDDEYGNVDVNGLRLDISYEVENIDNNIDSPEENLDGSDRPGQETPKDPVGPDDPTPPATGSIEFDSKTLMPFTATHDAYEFGEGAKEAKVAITSKEPIENLIVEIISPALPPSELEGLGLTAKFDLAHPADATDSVGNKVNVEQGLVDLGLLNPDKPILGQTDVEFDITSFIPMLCAISQPGQVHKFVLTVKDNTGASNTVTLTFKS